MSSDILNIRGWRQAKICGAKVIVIVSGWFICHGPGEVYLVLERLFWRRVRCRMRRAVSQVMRIARLGYFAGFCSQGRGLSWDRRSRYGEK